MADHRHPVKGGVHVALLGADGVGKTSLSFVIRELLVDLGLPVEDVTWKGAMQSSSQMSARLLSDLYVATYRSLLGAARLAPGHEPLRELLAVPAEEFLRSDLTALDAVEVEENDGFALVTTALLEVAGNIWLHSQEVAPRVRSGAGVVQDSWGLKHVLKELLMAQEAATAGDLPLVNQVREFSIELFTGVLAPDVVIVLAAAPELTLERRVAAGGSSSVFEDLRAAGTGAAGAWVRMQQQTQDAFLVLATRESWPVVEVRREPQSATARRLRRAAADAVGAAVRSRADRSGYGG